MIVIAGLRSGNSNGNQQYIQMPTLIQAFGPSDIKYNGSLVSKIDHNKLSPHTTCVKQMR